MNPLNIAIIGSGPSGCYSAQFLRKQFTNANIVIIDKLPVPFGLIRYGVAPDHIGTKQITQQFNRLFTQDQVKFIGNVEIGVQVSLDIVRQYFDIVILATGLHEDRKLAIVGENLPEVYGSGAITRYFNDHPEAFGFEPKLANRVVVVGNGNVAMDVVRLLLKQECDWHETEISLAVEAHIAKQNVKEIHVISRSSLFAAKFDAVMIKELRKLDHIMCHVVDADKTDNLPSSAQALMDLVDEQACYGTSDKKTKVVFYFNYTPLEILGTSNVTGLLCQDSQNNTVTLPADSLITAIGFEEDESKLMQEKKQFDLADIAINGKLDTDLYCVGWLKRGPRGTIPENRKDAKLVVEAIVEAVATIQIISKQQHLAHFYDYLETQQIKFSQFHHWQAMDQFEIKQAAIQRHRQKINSIEAMMQFVTKT